VRITAVRVETLQLEMDEDDVAAQRVARCW